jgi:hypothetical protein
MAAIPSPALIGVQRIAIQCDIGPNFTATEQRRICDQLIAKAKLYTNLPVSAATKADLDPLSGKMHKQQLLLRVNVGARDVEAGRKALDVEVSPVRLMTPMGAMPAAKSKASLVRVQKDWIVQGPVDAFQKVIGSTGKRRVRAPITSDR